MAKHENLKVHIWHLEDLIMMQIYHFSNLMFVVMALPPRFGWSFWHIYLFCTNTNEFGEFELNILKITNFDHCNPKMIQVSHIFWT